MSKKKKEDLFQISFIDEGAATDVTGSGVYIHTPHHHILLDCGLIQSNDRYADFLANRRKPKEFKYKDIDLVLISHNHGDHCLKIPVIFAEQGTPAVIVPQGAGRVMQTMLMDCVHIMERDVELFNNQKGKSYLPLYNETHVEQTMQHTLEYPINQKITIDDEVSFKLIPSGHLLNSVQVILYITIDNVTKTIGYTGDLGNNKIDNKYVGAFQPITEFCNIVIGESTYGDRPELKIRNKERQNDLDKFKTIIDTQVKELQGRVAIPSFAQSRSLQLITMIYQLYKNDTWQPKVYLDSPLAIALLQEYCQVLEEEELALVREILAWENLTLVKDTDASKALVESNIPCVIISTSGFCNVGRIRHYIKKLVSNPNSTLLFVGYSSEGSLASLLKDPKVKSITLDQKEYKCKCASYSLKSMSGHQPFEQLLKYYASLNCERIILHHGSTSAKESLAKQLKQELAKQCKTTLVSVANNSLKLKL